MEKNKGITLIALIITIIIMLLLASVAINAISGTDNFFEKTKEAANKYKQSASKEQELIEQLNRQIGVNWESVLEDATKKPDQYKHPDQEVTNKDIGIGTDGMPVNLDLWTYFEENGGITLAASQYGSPETAPSYQDQNATKIQGKVPQYIKLDGQSVFLPVLALNGTFAQCVNLTEVPELPGTATNFESTFYMCKSITSLPSYVFANCINANEFYRTFWMCTGLVSIPGDLFANCKKVTSFSTVFSGCSSLTSIPKDLFLNCQEVVRFSFAFYMCTSLTGEAPELWNRQNSPTGLDCFRGCTGLTNYASIPSAWKE